ncbi:mRNA cap guanine-N7 methyltransferase 1 isoform X2 [Quercus suber]|uniref:mRNA cap guanine-N7 methyltransferase 1 isoform X2 n=1 Tax=Quercus suber TaxID=58331 RepID=UPI0032DF0EA3
MYLPICMSGLILYLGDSQFLEDESTKIFARKVAEHYSARTNQTLEEREASPIIHLKKLNNWIKSVLIQLYARRGDAVLDLACGKGGDLIKWDKAKVGYYVGVDVAEGSIEDCRTRYNGDADHHQRRKKFTFPARLICGECYEARLDNILFYRQQAYCREVMAGMAKETCVGEVSRDMLESEKSWQELSFGSDCILTILNVKYNNGVYICRLCCMIV